MQVYSHSPDNKDRYDADVARACSFIFSHLMCCYDTGDGVL
ncbi:hypothetical protein [Acinetobacter sp. A47]|nr:hypothetical protein [Acinetobacter sp. A47]